MSKQYFAEIQTNLVSWIALGINPAEKNSNDDLIKGEILVIRNEAVELFTIRTEQALKAVSSNFTIRYSPYLDNPEFWEIPGKATTIVLWINISRILHHGKELSIRNYLKRAMSNENTVYVIAGVFQEKNNCIIMKIASELGVSVITPEEVGNDSFIHYQGKSLELPKKKSKSISKQLFWKIWVEQIQPKPRAIILDFDNTLYSGILAEDQSICVTEKHLEFISNICELASKGVVICGITKNSEMDVEKLLSSGSLAPLNRDLFTYLHATYESKSIAMQEILKSLNFAEDYVIFIDDNPREIYEMNLVYPKMLCLSAKDVEEVTFITELFVHDRINEVLSINPKTRTQDLRAKDIRSEFVSLSNRDPDLILVEMQTQLTTRVARLWNDTARGFELFQKTNQFNFTLARTNLSDSEKLLNLNQWLVITELRDKFSDSGTIASALFELNGTNLKIIEFCISCRAIGRNIEKYIFADMIETMSPLAVFETISVELKIGTRNAPAVDFCKQHLRRNQGNHYSAIKTEFLSPSEQITLSKFR
jgi:FkbH-like protein